MSSPVTQRKNKRTLECAGEEHPNGCEPNFPHFDWDSVSGINSIYSRSKADNRCLSCLSFQLCSTATHPRRERKHANFWFRSAIDWQSQWGFKLGNYYKSLWRVQGKFLQQDIGSSDPGESQLPLNSRERRGGGETFEYPVCTWNGILVQIGNCIYSDLLL